MREHVPEDSLKHPASGEPDRARAGYAAQAIVTPSFREALGFWLKLGFISFGGPAGQIAIMHTELVDRRRWIGEQDFLHALNFCMLLPGPEAQQLATYCGWRLHGRRGGLAAGILFVAPALLIMLALSYLYVASAGMPSVAEFLYGLKAAVLGLVAAALVRIGRKSVRGWFLSSIALAAFAALQFLALPFPLIIAGALLAGSLYGRRMPRRAVSAADKSDRAAACRLRDGIPRWTHVLAAGLSLWAAPIALAYFALGPSHSVTMAGIFFSKAALITFGGAYAVLPYVAQQAVGTFGWLSPSQMMDGLGLAETTPGPLIMVLQFVGFLAAYNSPGELPPLVSATLGALMTTWVTFLPCFLFVFLGAPYAELLRGSPRIEAALEAVSAAVVGVIMNLAVWFGTHLLFTSSGFDMVAAAIAISSWAALASGKAGMTAVVVAAGGMGLLVK